jgi:methylthioribose-1-phosphate isomerase
MSDSMAALDPARRPGPAWCSSAPTASRANGDFANKVGTYGLAVLARHHGVPFYCVAPTTTVDPACPDGAAIPIEGRDAAEVRGVVAGTHHVRWAPEAGGVFNPAFDVTPASLVTALVLDRAVVSAATLRADGLASLA